MPKPPHEPQQQWVGRTILARLCATSSFFLDIATEGVSPKAEGTYDVRG